MAERLLPGAFILELDGQGGACEVPLTEQHPPERGTAPRWLHILRDTPGWEQLLRDGCGLDEESLRALGRQHPRALVEEEAEDALFLVLELSSPEQPSGVELRVWVSPQMLISLARGPRPALQTEWEKLHRGRGPRSIGELMVALAGDTLALAQLRSVGLDERLADLELVSEKERLVPMERLRRLRVELISQRRYLTLVHDALLRVLLLEPHFLRPQLRTLRTLSRQAFTLLAELEALLERARALQEEANAREGARTQRALYLLTVISGIFLPLTFITGLLGANVGGIPLRENPWGFGVLSVLLLLFGVVEWQVLRKLRML
ncbi:MAG: hypothetical protein L0Y66_15270 [Myxococcaceae bacterium]|nr:hypothetical protein [Myxococcaceae bacterium]MCI0670496.1 hypothetical protein [Myxococcaceae bacterium]